MTTLFISHSSKDKAWALQIHETLRGQGYKKLFLDSHPEDGIVAGVKWEQDLWQHLRQSGAVIALCTANWIASPWCVAEAMIARERGKPVFLLATADVANGRQVKAADGREAAQIPDFLRDRQFISLAGITIEQAYQRLWLGLTALRKEIFPLPRQPYPGLKPFEEKDAAVFFGRNAEIAEVTEVLNRCQRSNAKRFVVVLGASGCGKSSLVRAGVLPQLRRPCDENDARDQWVIPSPFTGAKGLGGLTLSIASALKDAGQGSELAGIRGRLESAQQPDDRMEHAVQALGELAGELLFGRRLPEGAVLLVLDQLEEVFGTPEGSEQQSMLRLLLDASADPANPLIVLATMRSDFLNAFQLFEGAAERYEKVTLDPMPRSRFSEVIEGPAERFGLDLDAGLCGQMVGDTAYNDALPLLAFTLKKLYKKCKGQGRLTLAAYGDLGGVNASIKHTANAILEEAGYAGLPMDDPRMRDLRRAFYGLAQVGEEGQFARRTAHWSQMPASCAAVLRRFVSERLLVSDTASGEPILGVAHEALFRVWDTLGGWLRQDRKALVLRSQIEEAAAEWQAANRAGSRAWLEERILDAVRQIEESGVSLADVQDRATVDAFLGPTDPKHLETLPALGAAEDASAGSGRYGDSWRLPLGHEARASLGVRLALLGDHRKGVGVRADGLPDVDWRWIEGGEVTIDIRANPDDPSAEVVKRLTRTVVPLWMARFPVTIAQFQAFLRECHRDDQWRLPPSFKVGLTTDYPGPTHQARYDNHPADNVSWYDSMAFCEWLSTQLSFEVRLPTEYEWQRAASGSEPARTYPWGAEWDPVKEPWRANTFESGLGRSTAVGMYPAGASQRGILDMAGTLWEWCLDPFESSETAGGSWLGRLVSERRVPENRRVVRGGSWSNDRGSARLAYRGRHDPFDRLSSIGFRVVCSSPSSSSDH